MLKLNSYSRSPQRLGYIPSPPLQATNMPARGLVVILMVIFSASLRLQKYSGTWEFEVIFKVCPAHVLNRRGDESWGVLLALVPTSWQSGLSNPGLVIPMKLLLMMMLMLLVLLLRCV